MKYGMNLLLWTGEMNDSMLPVVKLLNNLGYDGVELPIFNTALDYKKWGKILDDHGLARTAVTIRTVEDNPISPDANIRKKGIEGTMRCLDCCAAAGCTTGPCFLSPSLSSTSARRSRRWPRRGPRWNSSRRQATGAGTKWR